MLTIAKLGRGREGYYLDSVASGAEDYYVGRGEAPGYWAGRGAELLGLDGEVTPDALRAVLAGRTPDGRVLRSMNGRIPGFDFTFSVPKSVSVLAALRPALSERIVDASEVAVARTLAWLEDNACASRRGRNGVEHVSGEGFVAAAFRHRTSRAGDPQLHWHVLVANTTRGPDGRWRTLDGTKVYPALRTAGFLFEAHLRFELSERFAVQWHPAKNGNAEIDGIPRALLRHFSKRRQDIEERLEAVGHTGGRAAQLAALTTRHRKAPTQPDITLRERWRSEAESIGFDAGTLDAALDRPRRRGDLRQVIPDLLGPTGLTHQASTFTRFDVLRALAERATDGRSIDDIDIVCGELLTHAEVVALGRSRADAGSVKLEGGRRLAGVTDRYSTRELLAIENRIVELALTAGGRRRPGVERHTAEWYLDQQSGLADEQRRAVQQLVTRRAPVDALIAPAGSGKTWSLRLARELWEQAQYRVIGASLAASAAKELEDQAGIPSRTVTRLLGDLEAGRELFDNRTVLVLDEAAMVGTRAIARLFEPLPAAGGRLVLVGDPKQLQAIEAGGVLNGLQHRIPVVELTQNRRQQQEWERHALAELRSGEIGKFLTEYRRNGRVYVGGNVEEARQRLVIHWATEMGFGSDAVMLAFQRRDIAELNRMAREHMIEAGRLGQDRLLVGDRDFRVGDRIVCLRNRPSDGLLNGMRGVVRSIDCEGRVLVVTLRDGTQRVLSTKYLEAGHVDHGYALTIHKAQGMTCDRAFVLATQDLYREAAYTALSRARIETRLYVVADDFADDPTAEIAHGDVHHAGDRTGAFLDRWFRQVRQEELAVDQQRRISR